VLKTIETLVNRYIALDPESKKRLASVDNTVIRVVLDGVPTLSSLQELTNFYLIIKQEKLCFEGDISDSPHVTIKGMPLSLWRLIITKDRKPLFADNIMVEGDVELADEVMRILDSLVIDWEECFSHWVGDVPAHQLGRFMRSVKENANRLQQSLLNSLNEYVHEEALWFPPVEAVQDFFHDIDVLRMDADRLEAKVRQLMVRIC
jgi:ubiquinone biosynthesis protein UbiJ